MSAATTPRVVSGKVAVWLSNSSYGPDDLLHGDAETVINKVTLTGNNMSTAGWVQVGEAEYTITFEPEATMVANKVDAIKAEIRKELAESQNRIVHLTQQLQSLLAIEAHGMSAASSAAKQFRITWTGYPNDPAPEVHPLDFFTGYNGYDEDLIEQLEALDVGDVHEDGGPVDSISIERLS